MCLTVLELFVFWNTLALLDSSVGKMQPSLTMRRSGVRLDKSSTPAGFGKGSDFGWRDAGVPSASALAVLAVTALF